MQDPSSACLLDPIPPSFHVNPENLRNLKQFLTNVDRRGVVIAWEPRGNWVDKPKLIRRVCDQLGIVHVVDLLRQDPSSSLSLVYCRLHGLGNRQVNYTYRHTDDDLKQLTRKFSYLEKMGCQEAYVLFNNVSMFEDAKRFSKMISRN